MLTPAYVESPMTGSHSLVNNGASSGGLFPATTTEHEIDNDPDGAPVQRQHSLEEEGRRGLRSVQSPSLFDRDATTVTTRCGTWSVGDEDTRLTFNGGDRSYGNLVNVGGDLFYVGGSTGVNEKLLFKLNRGSGHFLPVSDLKDHRDLPFEFCTSDNPILLTQNAAVAHGKIIYLIGSAGHPDLFLGIDTETNVVFQPEIKFHDRMPVRWHSHTAVLMTPSPDDPWILMYGGAEVGRGVVADVYAYRIKKKAFHKVPMPSPFAVKPPSRLYHCACSVRNRFMYVFGGAPDAKTTEPGDLVYDDLWRFDLASFEWRHIKPDASVASQTLWKAQRTRFAANSTSCSSASAASQKLHEPEGGEAEASRLHNIPSLPTHRGSASMHFANPYLYLFGGFDGQHDYAQMYRFDVDLELWQAVAVPESVAYRSGVWGYASCFDPVTEQLIYVGGFGSETNGSAERAAKNEQRRAERRARDEDPDAALPFPNGAAAAQVQQAGGEDFNVGETPVTGPTAAQPATATMLEALDEMGMEEEAPPAYDPAREDDEPAFPWQLTDTVTTFKPEFDGHERQPLKRLLARWVLLNGTSFTDDIAEDSRISHLLTLV